MHKMSFIIISLALFSVSCASQSKQVSQFQEPRNPAQANIGSVKGSNEQGKTHILREKIKSIMSSSAVLNHLMVTLEDGTMFNIKPQDTVAQQIVLAAFISGQTIQIDMSKNKSGDSEPTLLFLEK